MAKNPTDVVGLRIGAYLLDASLLFVLTVIGFSLSANRVPTPAEVNSCSSEATDNGSGTMVALDVTLDQICLYMNNSEAAQSGSGQQVVNETFLIDYSLIGVFALPVVYMVAGVWVLQGITGGSPGKLVCRLRVVNSKGEVAGILPSTIRSLMWVIDGLPAFCCLYFSPLVGGIAMFASKDHRRVGDRVAGTFVINKDDVGRVVDLGVTKSFGDTTPWGTTPGDPATPPPSAPDGQGSPQWDDARRAWIQYSPSRAHWLQHDPTSGGWRHIS